MEILGQGKRNKGTFSLSLYILEYTITVICSNLERIQRTRFYWLVDGEDNLSVGHLRGNHLGREFHLIIIYKAIEAEADTLSNLFFT